MLVNHFTAHISPRTGSPADRVAKAGIAVGRLLENIGSSSSPEEVHLGLMRSPGHRSAILDPDVTHVGIGVASHDLARAVVDGLTVKRARTAVLAAYGRKAEFGPAVLEVRRLVTEGDERKLLVDLGSRIEVDGAATVGSAKLDRAALGSPERAH